MIGEFEFGKDNMGCNSYMGTRHLEAVQATFPEYPELGGGGSLWIQCA